MREGKGNPQVKSSFERAGKAYELGLLKNGQQLRGLCLRGSSPHSTVGVGAKYIIDEFDTDRKATRSRYGAR